MLKSLIPSGQQFSAELIEAFSGLYLSPRYDQPQKTPQFHRDCWARYCGNSLSCATAAPRNHAKSTALTHDYILANVCWRQEEYIILIGASEEMAIEHLGDIASELRENDDLRRDFLIKDIIVDAKTDIIVECTDGHQFRIIARGAEQKIRGRKWNGKRPGLIVADDLEDDEQVENKDRRAKFRRWFFRAAKQALRDGGKIRVHGTILHVDSLLSHLIKNPSWDSKLYKAHRAFNDFSEILWPEKFPERRLRAIRDELVREGDGAGYSQEYLNDPRDNDEAYTTRSQYRAMSAEDHDNFKIFAAGVDFAISKAAAANKTSIIVGGKDLSHLVHVVDRRTGRWDTLEIIDELIGVQERWSPQVFFVEDGVIWKAIWPVIRAEMQKRDVWLNFQPMRPIKDKKTRGRSFQKGMKAGRFRFDKEMDGYQEYEELMLLFTGDAEALADDDFDATAWLSIGMEELEVDQEDSQSDEDLEMERNSRMLRSPGVGGRSQVTGY